jgi:hypothetical protein
VCVLIAGVNARSVGQEHGCSDCAVIRTEESVHSGHGEHMHVLMVVLCA